MCEGLLWPRLYVQVQDGHLGPSRAFLEDIPFFLSSSIFLSPSSGPGGREGPGCEFWFPSPGAAPWVT